jgi:hypothetical protein
MKILLLILLASFCCPPPISVVEKWKIEKDSNLYIEGRSNISSFSCGITEYLRPDTLCFYREALRQPVLSVKGGLTINVNRFNCQQQYMNKDLLKTLKANECPELKIALQTIGNFSGPVKNVKGTVIISLAGITRTMDVDYTVQYIDQNNLRLHGYRQVLFSDFGLTPPRKLAGLVKVEEQINVRFQLVLRSLNNTIKN